MSTDARSAILETVRAALGGPQAADEHTALLGWEQLPRGYDRAGRLSPEEKLALLEERLRDYDAEVARVTEEEIGRAIQDVLDARGGPRMLVAPGFPEHWFASGATVIRDDGFSPRELDSFEGVLTAAALGIAETGSLVLQNAPGQGRRAVSLVPDFHLCVVRTDDVVENVPEAFARLRATCTLPTTFISGPSATADIEMTRIKGVHGPRFLYVLLMSRTI